RKKVDLIITHHPLIFKPIRTILLEDRVGRLLSEIMKNDIAVYALHTNLDFTQNGVSFSLAERIGLGKVSVLHQHHRIYKKIVVYVPEDHSASLIAAMSAEGAGVIGHYEFCSFRSKGFGTFRPRAGAKPYVGNIGRLEMTD